MRDEYQIEVMYPEAETPCDYFRESRIDEIRASAIDTTPVPTYHRVGRRWKHGDNTKKVRVK